MPGAYDNRATIISQDGYGSVGLMQVIPGENRGTTQQLQDPAFNIEAGTKLLNLIYQDPSLGNGNWRDTIALYNTGSWEKLFGEIPETAGYSYADRVLIDGGIDPSLLKTQEIYTSITPNTSGQTSLKTMVNISNSSNPQSINFAYFSQKDPQWQDLPVWSGSIADDGCGVMVGAMVTGLTPEVYYQEFQDYFASQGFERLVSSDGTDYRDHVAVLESMGYTEIPLSGTLQELKDQVKKYTEAGTPVWIGAQIYGTPHFTMAIGVDENNNLILNDPYFGENTHISDSDIVNNGWRFSAIVSP